MLSSALKRSAAQLQGLWQQPQLAAALTRTYSTSGDLQEVYNRRVGHEDCPVSDLESHASYQAGYLHRTLLEHGTMMPSSFWQRLSNCTIESDGAYKVVRLPRGHHFFDSETLGSTLLLTPGRQHLLNLADAYLKDPSRKNLTFAVCGASNTGKSFFLLEFMRQARVQGKAVLYHTPQGYRFYPAGPDVNYCWELGNTFHAQTTPQDLWGGKESSVVYITDGVDPRCGEPADALTFAALPADAEFMPVSGANNNVELVSSADMTWEDLLKLREVEPLFQDQRPLEVVREAYDLFGPNITSCLMGSEEHEGGRVGVAPYDVIGSATPHSPRVNLVSTDSVPFAATLTPAHAET